ncbi:MAG: transcription-repair coupling factor [Cellulosilyticaceae bacterium]
MNDRFRALTEPLKEIPGFELLIQNLNKKGISKVVNMVDSMKPHFIYGVSCYAKKKGMVIITEDEIKARKIYEDMQFLVGDEKVYLYPARDILFYNADVHSMDITAQRINIIEMLNNNEPIVVVIPIEALLNPLSPKETWLSYRKSLKEADVLEIKGFERHLIEIGYERVARVEAVGQFSVRGGIIDIYPPISNLPYRIELWDDEIDSIRTFNPSTQRSIERVSSITIVPSQEIIFPLDFLSAHLPQIQKDAKTMATKLREAGKRESAESIQDKIKEVVEQIENNITPRGLESYVTYTNLRTVTLIDYLDPGAIIYMDEPLKSREHADRVLEEYHESMQDRLEYGHILPKQIELIFELEDILQKLSKFTQLYLMNFDKAFENEAIEYTLNTRVYENTTFYNNLDLLEKDIREWKENKKKIIIFSGIKAKATRLVEELENRGILASYAEELAYPLQPGQIVITKGSLQKGFAYEDIGFYIIADKDLFGKEKKARKTRKKYQGTKIESFLELVPGDYVVHENHGIGIFKGIEQIVVEGISRDNLKIEYSDGSSLYVNINQMDMVQKYVGAEGKVPKLSKLGTSEWKKTKAKVKGAVKDIAKDLIMLYSKRQYTRGFNYEDDNVWQNEFEEMFPYEETGDQLDAIEDVKKDMESDKIMDRLVCGDVGYGKTEVAIRAAFKAVQSNKQVAYLVPTTILAQQHYERFVERMQHYPIKVELLSRFRTPKQTKHAIEGIGRGTVDIVIGTHRLLSKDVNFKDLGLVIIDEEQRFGVGHKEKLKQMRTEVDVLTLTATPIPRTLHMSLIGIRDMSVLEEAPLERKPVQTYVIEYSKDFVKDAINRELARRGQVYFLYNQVKDIEKKAIEIQTMVPHARVEFAHGQMSERELERIMLAFIEGEIDVLVCTTIVETGLDISNVNTIIINDADRMGLSQLYQLRGRVGRSNKVGYAYLMYQKNKALKEIAEKRLQAIKQFTELGAGFKIAMRDLEIRGAGNLLGSQQHGHMEAIGYDLYSKMLQEAVSLEKGEIIRESFETSIEMKIDAYIPAKYISDEVQRLDIYKKIASIQSDLDYQDVQEEIEDRYGNLPKCVQSLLDIAHIKWMANQLDILTVAEVQKEIFFKFKQDANLDSQRLPELLNKYPRVLKFTSGKEPALKANIKDVSSKDLLDYIKNMLQEIKKLKNA